MSCKCHEGSGTGVRSPEDAEKFEELDRYITSLLDNQTPERRRGSLIQVLHRAQHLFGYLSEEVQKFVSSRLQLPRAEIYGVISFYSYFTDQPVGRYKINVCTGTACFVKTMLVDFRLHFTWENVRVSLVVCATIATAILIAKLIGIKDEMPFFTAEEEAQKPINAADYFK